MISREGCGCSWPRHGCKMPCESCGVQFSVFRRKRACSECERLHCSACLRRGGGLCAPCRALCTRPLARAHIAHLKVRDLQCFLQRQNVSTRGCVEKEELVSLCVSHVNSAAYRRRGARGAGGGGGAGAFTLKGLTTNINDFITSAFDLRPPPHAPQPPSAPQPPPAAARNNSSCHNTAHAHSPPPRPAPPPRERFTTRPGGEADILVAAPAPAPCGGVPRSASEESARVDTADCYEIEDLDDSGWEFVTRPADPLPNDSEVLLAATEGGGGARAGGGAPVPPGRGVGARAGGGALVPPAGGGSAPRTPQRAASELELRRSESAASPDTADSASLQDEPLLDGQPPDEEAPGPGAGGAPVTLERVRSASELEELNVKQLKELLARNRVEYRGCVERAELLERARRLWDHHAKYKDEIDTLPIEECCKICMAAPLECVLLECGHIAACTACSKQLAECPICRQYVVRAVRFFRS